ncbi:hypothetical protein [Kitasatospora herbaricolor]|uniref:Uncharacterized protein n=1 Tax=Kitasatospora herbaricolor TaxID=68217 RepID=A0ABZ1WMH9_9ACTN|nr:hypothetical protein [Kitasatospora herbaricolor]
MNPQDFLGPTFERRVAYGQAGTACVTESDLQRLIQHLVMDTHSIRIALASAVHQVLYGGHELPTSDYMQNLIENMLFDDIMGAGGNSQLLAETLRGALRLLEGSAGALDVAQRVLKLRDATGDFYVIPARQAEAE